MNEDEKKDVAVFRFGVIHDFVNGLHLERGEQERLLRDKCKRKWFIPHSSRTRLTRSTILRWIKRYQESNGRLESLYPPERSDRGKSRGLDEESALALIRIRKEFPKTPVVQMIEELKKRGALAPGREPSLSTVYRFLHHHDLMHPARSKPEDRRKFEAELPNDLWQSDAMHGPKVEVEGKMRKSYLLAFLDDHSRLVPHGEFYLSEGISAYLDALQEALVKRGLPRKLYIDNGPAFRSKHLEHVTAALGIALIHSRPYKPQGRGKIERFFRTVRTQFLPGFKGKGLEELNEAFELWLDDIYHQRKHSATGQNPFDRFTSRMQCLRAAPEDLRDYFRKHARRRVARDRTITLNSKLYEAPLGLIGKQVLLLYHDQNPQRIEVTFNHKSYGLLTPLDLHINSRVKRDRNSGTDVQSSDNSSRRQGGKLWSTERGEL
ncbi:MAG: transposase [Deltaproteobacteria bacterium]|nr:transposase [Deltaproteobacteria bacterium]